MAVTKVRRVVVVLGVALAALMTGASPAQAQCPGNDGTLPGSSDSVTTVATPAATLYVDDRDFLDHDDDGDAGGIWIYLESNNRDGLQRGGDHVAFATLARNGINPDIPRLDPFPVYVDVPVVGRVGITLFPCGLSGSEVHVCQGRPRLAEMLGFHDDCVQSSNPDTLVY